MNILKWLLVLLILITIGYLGYIYLWPQAQDSISLKTADSTLPAAGVCDQQAGEVIAVEIWPDVPQPRCVKVFADQRLKVINRTESEISIGFNNLPVQALGLKLVKIPPDGEYVATVKFGQYLAPGVHQLLAKPFSGPEIWLTSNSWPI